MGKFINEYLDPAKELVIADIGSQSFDSGDSYKSLCKSPKWKYMGCDIVEGNNVDVVLTSAYNWREIASASIDVVISGQAFEHIEFFWVTMSEISRVLKEEGLCCIIAPSSGVYHPYPVDCWRYYEDGMRALAKYVNFEVLDVQTQRDRLDFAEFDATWQDSVLICKKPKMNAKQRYLQIMRQKMNRSLVKNMPHVGTPQNVAAQLFFCVNGQYSEEYSLRRLIKIKDNQYSAAFDLSACSWPEMTRFMEEIRFDPASEPITFTLTDARVFYKNGERKNLKIKSTNGEESNVITGGGYEFNHNDPIMIFDSSEIYFIEADHISFSGAIERKS
jgi:hypothetical protein